MAATRVTLLVSNPSWDGIKWRREDPQIRRLTMHQVSAAIRRGTYGEASIERVIIEEPLDPAEFLIFLSSIPRSMDGDTVLLDGAEHGFLSAAADGESRVLYELSKGDIDFYLEIKLLREGADENRWRLPEFRIPAPAKKRVKVLVADDDRRARDRVVALLRELGCETLTASSGYEAILMSDLHRPAILVLDGLMPEMHGFEVARFVRGLDTSYSPRIIVLTAVYKNARYRNDAMLRCGVDDYLVKPATPEQLAAAIFGEERAAGKSTAAA